MGKFESEELPLRLDKDTFCPLLQPNVAVRVLVLCPVFLIFVPLLRRDFAVSQGSQTQS